MNFDTVRDVLDHYGVEIDFKKGNAQNYLIRCPFHNDRHPSCSVHKSTGLFLCFACGEQGNIIQLIAKLEGCDYETAEKMWESGDILKLETIKEKEPDWEKGFLRLVKTINEIVYFRLDNVENNLYISTDDKRLFWDWENGLWEEWFYFGLIKDPYQKLVAFANEVPVIKKAIQVALRYGEQRDKLSL